MTYLFIFNDDNTNNNDDSSLIHRVMVDLQ